MLNEKFGIEDLHFNSAATSLRAVVIREIKNFPFLKKLLNSLKRKRVTVVSIFNRLKTEKHGTQSCRVKTLSTSLHN